MDSAPYGIHIVGGGLSGYAAALALAGHGENLTLYERTAPQPPPNRPPQPTPSAPPPSTR